MGRNGYAWQNRIVRPLNVAFIGSGTGTWSIDRLETVAGEPLAVASRLEVVEGAETQSAKDAVWVLRGVTSNERYVTVSEHLELAQREEPLGRDGATRAALIPITKSEAWWALAQDERRRILEDRSRHIATGLEYLPAIARRLHHGRDLGEPFDFLTWFEFAPEYAAAFEELVRRLRETEEWTYVEREIDIRLTRLGPGRSASRTGMARRSRDGRSDCPGRQGQLCSPATPSCRFQVHRGPSRPRRGPLVPVQDPAERSTLVLPAGQPGPEITAGHTHGRVPRPWRPAWDRGRRTARCGPAG